MTRKKMTDKKDELTSAETSFLKGTQNQNLLHQSKNLQVRNLRVTLSVRY